MAVRCMIQEIALEHRRRYRYRRVTAELRTCGMLANYERVARMMCADKLLAPPTANSLLGQIGRKGWKSISTSFVV